MLDHDFTILNLCEPLMFDKGKCQMFLPQVWCRKSSIIVSKLFPGAQPICLPDPAQDYDNVSTVVTGWGLTNTDPQDQGGALSLVEIHRDSKYCALIG